MLRYCFTSSNGVNVGETATPHPHLQCCQMTDSLPALTDGPFCCTATWHPSQYELLILQLLSTTNYLPRSRRAGDALRPPPSLQLASVADTTRVRPQSASTWLTTLQRLYPLSTLEHAFSTAFSTIDAAPRQSVHVVRLFSISFPLLDFC